MVAEKRWKDAREFYTKGILALKQERQELPEDLVSEDEKEKAIEEACYVNRALCNLELSTLPSPFPSRLSLKTIVTASHQETTVPP